MSKLQVLTFVFLVHRVDPLCLNEKDLNAYKRYIRRLLKTYAPEAVGLFVIDISFNILTYADGHDYWQIEFHGILRNISPEELAQIRKHVRKRDGKRSLYMEDVYEPIGQLAYMAKPNFARKIRYLDDKVRKRTHDKPLTLDQELLLNEWLDGYSVESRIFQVGTFGDATSK